MAVQGQRGKNHVAIAEVTLRPFVLRADAELVERLQEIGLQLAEVPVDRAVYPKKPGIHIAVE